jgi:hypothetical protein
VEKPGRPQKPDFLLFCLAKGNPVILSSRQEGLSSNVFLLQREATGRRQGCNLLRAAGERQNIDTRPWI